MEYSREKIEILKDVSVPIEIRLGSASISLKDVLDLKPGSHIVLDADDESPVVLYANKKAIAECQLMVNQDHYALKILRTFDDAEDL